MVTKETAIKIYSCYREIEASKKLLNDRDEFIANQINTTLDKVGIAFFGAAHSIVNKLNEDIKVIVIRVFNDEISLKLINNAK